MEKKYQDKDYFKENEGIRAFFSYAERSKDIHSHTFWELSYAYEGCGTSCIHDSECEVQNEEIYFIKPGSRHAFISKKKEEGAPLMLCSCIFTQEYMLSIMDEYRNIPGVKNYALYNQITGDKPFAVKISDDNAKNVLHLIWLITHEYNHFTIGSELVIRNSLISLLVCLTRLYEYQAGNATPMVTKSTDLDVLVKYISTNYGSQLSLDLLAANMHLSREYLCRYFKKQTGKTIFEFITETRIAKAKSMLRTTTHSVTDIGFYVGYPSVSSFQRAFKSKVGMSPNEFRAAERAKK